MTDTTPKLTSSNVAIRNLGYKTQMPSWPTRTEWNALPEKDRAYYVGHEGCYLSGPEYGASEMASLFVCHEADRMDDDSAIVVRCAYQIPDYEKSKGLDGDNGHELPSVTKTNWLAMQRAKELTY